MNAFRVIPDPRKAPCRRHPWLFLLTLMGASLARGQQIAHAIAHWVTLHGPELLERFRPPRRYIPSESALRRALHGIDIRTLERRFTGLAQYLAATGPKQGTVKTEACQVLRGQALNGKELRGAGAHGQKLHLLSFVQHGSGRTLTQMCADKNQREHGRTSAIARS
jgi:hypothetical protein